MIIQQSFQFILRDETLHFNPLTIIHKEKWLQALSELFPRNIVQKLFRPTFWGWLINVCESNDVVLQKVHENRSAINSIDMTYICFLTWLLSMNLF